MLSLLYQLVHQGTEQAMELSDRDEDLSGLDPDFTFGQRYDQLVLRLGKIVLPGRLDQIDPLLPASQPGLQINRQKQQREKQQDHQDDELDFPGAGLRKDKIFEYRSETFVHDYPSHSDCTV